MIGFKSKRVNSECTGPTIVSARSKHLDTVQYKAGRLVVVHGQSVLITKDDTGSVSLVGVNSHCVLE